MDHLSEVPATPGQEFVLSGIFKDFPSSPTGHFLEHLSSDDAHADHDIFTSSTVGSPQGCGTCTSLRNLTPDARSSSGRIRFGVESLDDLLGGGIKRGTVIDLAGDSSSGKTQLVLQLILRATLGLATVSSASHRQSGSSSSDPARSTIIPAPKFDQAESVVLFLAGPKTAGLQVTNRLRSMLYASYGFSENAVRSQAWRPRKEDSPTITQKRQRDASENFSEPVTLAALASIADRMFSNLHISFIPTIEHLQHMLTSDLRLLKERLATTNAPLGLIILDNLPSVLSVSQDSTFQGMMQRSRVISEMFTNLKELSAPAPAWRNQALPSSLGLQMGSAVLVINHLASGQTAARAHLIDRGLRSERDSSILKAAATPNYETQAFYSSGLQSTLYCLARNTEDHSAAADMLSENTDHDPLASTPKVAQGGPAWTSAVNARIILLRSSQNVPIPSATQGANAQVVGRLAVVRQVSLSFCAWTHSGPQHGPANFVITASGCESVNAEVVTCLAALRLPKSLIPELASKEEADKVPQVDNEIWSQQSEIPDEEFLQALQKVEAFCTPAERDTMCADGM